MIDIESFREELHSLISKFQKDKNYYLSKGYLEAQVRLDPVHDKLVFLVDRMLDLHKKKSSPHQQNEKR
jgi:uncharacterized coiled-coil protein SlyX